LSGLCSEPDPVIKYLFSADQDNWDYGGNLTGKESISFYYPPISDPLAVGGISFSGTYSDYYRNGGLETIGSSFRRQFCTALFVRTKTRFPSIIFIQGYPLLRRYQFVGAHENQIFTVIDKEYNTVIGLQSKIYSFQTGGSMNVNWHDSPEYEIFFGYDFLNDGNVSLLWKNYKFDDDLDLVWEDGETPIQFSSKISEYKVRLQTPLIFGFQSDLSYDQGDWLKGSKRQINYFEPYGKSYKYNALIKYYSDRLITALGIRGNSIDLTAYGRKGGLSYSKVTEFLAENSSMFGSVTLNTRTDDFLLFEVEKSIWEVKGRGHIEFWPFTTGLVDYLGLRRYFIAHLSIDYLRFHIGGSRSINDRLTLKAGSNIFDVQVKGSGEHWRPDYLLFGKTDEQMLTLAVRRLLAGSIHLGVNYRINRFRIKYVFGQLFPIKVWHRAVSITPTPDETQIGTVRKGYGGGFHSITVSRSF
jgi:hypothetical protein